MSTDHKLSPDEIDRAKADSENCVSNLLEGDVGVRDSIGDATEPHHRFSASAPIAIETDPRPTAWIAVSTSLDRQARKRPTGGLDPQPSLESPQWTLRIRGNRTLARRVSCPASYLQAFHSVVGI